MLNASTAAPIRSKILRGVDDAGRAGDGRARGRRRGGRGRRARDLRGGAAGTERLLFVGRQHLDRDVVGALGGVRLRRVRRRVFRTREVVGAAFAGQMPVLRPVVPVIAEVAGSGALDRRRQRRLLPRADPGEVGRHVGRADVCDVAVAVELEVRPLLGSQPPRPQRIGNVARAWRVVVLLRHGVVRAERRLELRQQAVEQLWRHLDGVGVVHRPVVAEVRARTLPEEGIGRGVVGAVAGAGVDDRVLRERARERPDVALGGQEHLQRNVGVEVGRLAVRHEPRVHERRVLAQRCRRHRLGGRERDAVVTVDARMRGEHDGLEVREPVQREDIRRGAGDLRGCREAEALPILEPLLDERRVVPGRREEAGIQITTLRPSCGSRVCVEQHTSGLSPQDRKMPLGSARDPSASGTAVRSRD